MNPRWANEQRRDSRGPALCTRSRMIRKRNPKLLDHELQAISPNISIPTWKRTEFLGCHPGHHPWNLKRKNLVRPGAEITDSRGYPDPTPSEELDPCLYIIMVVPSQQLEMEGEECTPGTNGKNQAAHLQLKNTRPV